LSATIKGEPSDFVDTQGFSVKFKEPDPSNDTTEYRQVLSIAPAKIENAVDFNQLTSNTVEKLFSLTDAAFEIVMMVTQPEIQELLNLTFPVDAQIATRFWSITLTSVSGGSTVIEGTAAISKFNITDAGVGFATIEMTLDFESSATVVGVLTAGVP